ncbi:proteasome complex subunit Rpn13 ubiquitin receptor-domain-containing protein [Melampsora americana]|nr:proteasome complex subunit Rpn13 ubiquitin receptor-domain-containing protein [Melampsora americana]
MTRLLQFRAGRCERRGQTNIVDPLPSKGLLYVESRAEDGDLHHLCYKDLESGAIVDDFILFSGDATFKKVLVPNSATARVYALGFSSSNQRVLYWMQDVDSSSDVSNVRRLNEFIDGPADDDEAMPIDVLDQSRSSTLPAQSSIQETQEPAIPNVTAEQMNQFNNLLAAFSATGQQSRRPPYALTDILTLDAIGPLLESDPDLLIPQLAPHLPPDIEATASNIKKIVNSADFRNGVRSLDIALQRNLGDGLKLFFLHGLGLESGYEGVEEYIEAVKRRAERD